jgi:hypothetical protein
VAVDVATSDAIATAPDVVNAGYLLGCIVINISLWLKGDVLVEGLVIRVKRLLVKMSVIAIIQVGSLLLASVLLIVERISTVVFIELGLVVLKFEVPVFFRDGVLCVSLNSEQENSHDGNQKANLFRHLQYYIMSFPGHPL